MGYSKEPSDLPSLVVVRPSYDSSGAVTGVAANFNYVRRVKNDANAEDQLPPIETGASAVDLYDNVKTVNIPGVGIVSYRKVAIGLKLIGDAERGA